MFKINEKGNWEFLHGKEAYREAVLASKQCNQFVEDDEDELVTEEWRSCYNCLFRRWTMNSLLCMKPIDIISIEK